MTYKNLESKKLVVAGGMARTGTTFLYHNFQLHPDIYVPARKELAFFSYNFEHGVNWYQSFFKGMKDETCAVDISPAYFMDKDAIDRIREYGQDVRVILGVRRPTDWIYSMYGHYGDMFSVPDFREFLNGCTLHREGKDYDLEFRNQKIKKTIELYQETFKEKLFIYDFSLLKTDPLFLLSELERFMGISIHFSAENIISGKVHARGSDSGRSITRVLNTIPGLATLVSRILPTSFLMAVRRRFEATSDKNSNWAPRETVDMFLTNEDREHAASVLNEDEAYYLTLFKNGPILQGRP